MPSPPGPWGSLEAETSSPSMPAGRMDTGQNRCRSGGNQTVAVLHMWGDTSVTLAESVSFL